MTTTAVAFSLTSGYTTKDCTSRSPCLSFTHSPCRGDFSSRAFAQSCAGAAEVVSQARQSGSRKRFMDGTSWIRGHLTGLRSGFYWRPLRIAGPWRIGLLLLGIGPRAGLDRGLVRVAPVGPALVVVAGREAEPFQDERVDRGA